MDNAQKIIELEALASAVMGGSCALPMREVGYIYRHGRRVAGLCLWLARRLGERCIPRPRLYAAALFHDVAKGVPEHAAVGARLMPGLLESICGVSESLEIARLVGAHNLRRKPNRCKIDEQILQDADVLDHFGAQNIWLSVFYASKSGGEQEQLRDFLRGRMQAEYIERSRAGLNFAASRAELKKRLAFQQEFLRRLEAEMMPNFIGWQTH